MVNPFQAESPKSVSFKGVPVGHEPYVMEILSEADLVQSRDYDTDKPKFFTNPDGTQGNPMMSFVVTVKVISGPNHVGEERSLWADKSSAKAGETLYNALKEAAFSSPAKAFEIGGVLTVQNYSTTPARNPKHADRKLYKVKYEPPAAKANNPFGSTTDESTPPF